MITTGRTLGADGRPVPGTGFEVDPDGELGGLLAKRDGPVSSHPTQPVWNVPLPDCEDDPETIRSVGVYGPGYDGPPEHYHEQSVERFEVLSGEVTFQVDGRDRTAGAGETVTVGRGERHTFGVESDDLSYVRVDIGSPGRLRHVLPTLGGLAHDDDTALRDPLQLALLADRLDGNTVFTAPSESVVQPLRAALAPLARLRGYNGAYAKYTRDAFWERHVEQPDL